MVYPRFDSQSFWNFRDTCEMVGAKHPAAPLGLITVAALLPSSWSIRLVDCNTEEFGEADYEWADVVMTGGMLPQQLDVQRIIKECRARGKVVVVGGPDVTSSPHMYEAADFRILGEAEGIMDAFIEAWDSGARSGSFESPKFQVDVTTSPIPRFDLLKFQDYFHVGLQFSRGCPFDCEFCDIIELYGRVPRAKTPEQVLAELEALYELGYRGHVDFVDDNLIGNKKALRALLPRVIEWQRERNYPYEFSTEASLNLAEDPRLMKMMREAQFFAVFVGIESPDPIVLVAMQKKQNTRRDIAESIHKIYDAGIFVLAGFIIGFDKEFGTVAEPMVRLIEDAAIPVCMVGLLYALPNTQLTRRLQREGRLYVEHDVEDGLGDQCTTGLNFVTQRPRREILADYQEIVRRVYDPERYFRRLSKVGQMLNMSGPGPRLSAAHILRDLTLFFRLAWNLNLRRPELRRYFWTTLIECGLRNPRAVKSVLMMLALYVHLGPFSRSVTDQIERKIEEIDAGQWERRELMQA
jgi:radical SAM superfamily enzyme YgiQ (UPF0313 family)